MLDIPCWKECVQVYENLLDITDVLKTLTSELVSSFIMVSSSLNWIREFCTFSIEGFLGCGKGTIYIQYKDWNPVI